MLWREPLGPGWSSPVVAGGRVFTQEQRGPDEVVACYDAGTGSQMWVHADRVRFEESLSGAGPRGTPTVADGLVYTFGATGILNCLDAASGRVKWSKNVATESGVKPPMWGFAASPLVERGLVIVYVGGVKGLVACRAESGEFAWSVASGEQSYTSPQAATLGGTAQVLFLSDHALIAVDPASGSMLWEHVIPAPGAPRAIQPHAISDSQVLVSSETDLGTALLEVTYEGAAWHAQQKWVSRALKPSFDDFVVSDGHAYGFDGAVFCCVDLNQGKRSWREGRYGHGQVLLLDAQKLLLIIGEEGDAILLRATPERNEEVGRFHAVSGKMWSHPALAGNRLVVRSDQEIACFELVPGSTQ
jgi:outer membrane protein assembly factor BamB